MLLEVGDRLQPELVGRLLGHRDLVGARERRRRERRQPVLLELGLGLLVGRLRVLREVGRVLAEEHGQRGAGVLRVGVDLAALQRGQRDVLVAEVEVGRGVVAGGGQALGVDLAQHLLLGEVLRADLQRDLGVVGVVDDAGRLGGLRGGGGLPGAGRLLLVVAARRDAERQRRQQRGQIGGELAHGAVWILLLVRPKRARARPSAPRSSLMPAGVTARWTADRPTSAAIASAATMIEAPIWPSRP